MKLAGYLLITIAFLAGSLVATVDKAEVNWVYFAAAIVLGIAGVFAARASSDEKLDAAGAGAGKAEDLINILDQVETAISGIKDESVSISPYDVPGRIDETVRHGLTKFVDNRKVMIRLAGLTCYADVMGHFAAGERYLNRVWSAGTDGYIDEVSEYIDKSLEEFRLSRKCLVEYTRHNC